MVNSRLDQFTAAPSGSLRMEFTLPGRPLSRSYGAILPSSLTRVISLTSVCSTCPPVSVIGTGTRVLPRGFSWRHGIRDWPAVKPAGIAPRVRTPPRISLRRLATCLPQDNHRLGSLTLPRHPIGHSGTTWYRNINLLAIGYAFRPRLRSRLTLGGITCPRKPWAYGERDSHPFNRYLSPHIRFLTLHGPFPDRFTAARNALLPRDCSRPRLRLPAYSR